MTTEQVMLKGMRCERAMRRAKVLSELRQSGMDGGRGIEGGGI